MNINKQLLALASAMSLLLATSCNENTSSESKSNSTSETSTVSTSESTIESTSSISESSSESTISSESSSVIEKKDFTITTDVSDGYTVDEKGNYLINVSGEYTLAGDFEGSILLSSSLDSKVTLYLNNFNATSEDLPCIYWQSEDKKVVINSLENTINSLTLADSGDYSTIESENNVEIVGNGKLTVNSIDSKHAIKGSDITVSNANLYVASTGDGLHGKSILIEGGTVSIESEKDGIEAELNKKSQKGTVEIYNSICSIIGKNAIVAATSITINSNEPINATESEAAILSNEDFANLNK